MGPEICRAGCWKSRKADRGSLFPVSVPFSEPSSTTANNRQPPPTAFSPSHPTITLGPYTGDQLSVDHIIPFSVAPQLDHVIANLELMPLRMNQSMMDQMTGRQHDMAARLRRAGLY